VGRWPSGEGWQCDLAESLKRIDMVAGARDAREPPKGIHEATKDNARLTLPCPWGTTVVLAPDIA
jgi:hypothetical protein